MSDTNNSFDDYFNSNFEDGLSSPSKYILRFTYEAGQQSRQKEIDRLNEALKYMLEQLDHPYRTSGEKVEKEVNNILKKR